jgi:hypothetical protein
LRAAANRASTGDNWTPPQPARAAARHASTMASFTVIAEPRTASARSRVPSPLELCACVETISEAHEPRPICFQRKRSRRPSPERALRGGSARGTASVPAPRCCRQRGARSKFPREAINGSRRRGLVRTSRDQARVWTPKYTRTRTVRPAASSPTGRTQVSKAGVLNHGLTPDSLSV